MAAILDTSDCEIIRTDDGYFRHVSHERRLLTSGWMTREAAERNADGYKADPTTLDVLKRRYEENFPEPPASPAP